MTINNLPLPTAAERLAALLAEELGVNNPLPPAKPDLRSVLIEGHTDLVELSQKIFDFLRTDGVDI